MSELTVGYLLLHGAVVATEALTGLSGDHADRAFYEGKQRAAIYFAHNVLPTIIGKAKIVAAGDRSAIEMPDDGFGCA
jgi:hypothetical protein